MSALFKIDLALKNIRTKVVSVVAAQAVGGRLRLRIFRGRTKCLHERLEVRLGLHGSQMGMGLRRLGPWHFIPISGLLVVPFGGELAVAPNVGAIAELPPFTLGGSAHP